MKEGRRRALLVSACFRGEAGSKRRHGGTKPKQPGSSPTHALALPRPPSPCSSRTRPHWPTWRTGCLQEQVESNRGQAGRHGGQAPAAEQHRRPSAGARRCARWAAVARVLGSPWSRQGSGISMVAITASNSAMRASACTGQRVGRSSGGRQACAGSGTAAPGARPHSSPHPHLHPHPPTLPHSRSSSSLGGHTRRWRSQKAALSVMGTCLSEEGGRRGEEEQAAGGCLSRGAEPPRQQQQ